MGLLNREKLLAKEKLEIKKVDFGDGDFVYVRQMTGRERDSWERSLWEVGDIGTDGKTPQVKNRNEDFRAKLAAHTVCDAEGNLILKPEDYEVLSTHMSAKKLEKIVNIAQGMNKISEEDKENLLKNSEAALSGGDTSESASH